ncbi:hypothetical protein MRB53_036313 [Persea americana]|nr:hypothetical protein MRB53_039270 [Persea americana]KAJ8613963.1 hypothetical protein MRB53_036754 [Persea americana]KAJ8614761.1 hypothetical protein MRB53_036427 [Persea americana]KAJ8614900.1 hypothetical protein MRB53_036313 [Persea americana]
MGVGGQQGGSESKHKQRGVQPGRRFQKDMGSDSRRRPLCWANRLSRLVASLMAVTKEQATFPPIHQTATLDVAPLAACTVHYVHSLLQEHKRSNSFISRSFVIPKSYCTTPSLRREGKEVF